MLRACRLDVGADVVYVPSRDVLVIHPDLDYAEAIGAVSGTLPDMHPDLVIELVEQVTPRPHPERRSPIATLASRLFAAAILMCMGTLLAAISASPASAEAKFGETFHQQMASMGMVCRDLHPGDGAQHCFLADGTVYEVRGYVRPDANLYVLNRDGRRTSILIFEDEAAAAQYRREHPSVSMAGRVAVW